MLWLKKLVGSMLSVIGLSMVMWWWACDFQKVGPTDTLTTKVSEVVSPYGGIDKISGVTTSTILKKLEESRTLAQADTAIRLLFDKTGVKHYTSPPSPLPLSKFGVFYLPDAALSKLAAWHLRFVTGKDTLSLAGKTWKVDTLNLEENFASLASLHEYVDREMEIKIDVDKALKTLQKDAEKALRDSETPENALLVSIVAEGSKIPSKIKEYNAKTLRSPVQHFLLALWLTVQYGEVKATPSPVHKKQMCLLRCYGDLVVDILFCRLEPDRQAREACTRSHSQDFIECTHSCFHDQGGGGGAK